MPLNWLWNEWNCWREKKSRASIEYRMDFWASEKPLRIVNYSVMSQHSHLLIVDKPQKNKIEMKSYYSVKIILICAMKTLNSERLFLELLFSTICFFYVYGTYWLCCVKKAKIKLSPSFQKELNLSKISFEKKCIWKFQTCI